MIKTKSERGAAMKKLFRFVSIVLAMFTFDYYVSMMLYGMRDCVAALVKDNGLYTGGNGDFAYFSYN